MVYKKNLFTKYLVNARKYCCNKCKSDLTVEQKIEDGKIVILYNCIKCGNSLKKYEGKLLDENNK